MFPLHVERLADAVSPASIYHNLAAVIETHCLKHCGKDQFSAICSGRTQVRNKGISSQIPPSTSARRRTSFPKPGACHFYPPSRNHPIHLTVFISALISCCLDHSACFSDGSVSGFASMLSALHMVARDSFLNKHVIPLLNILPWFSIAFRAEMEPASFLSTHFLISPALFLLILNSSSWLPYHRLTALLVRKNHHKFIFQKMTFSDFQVQSNVCPCI